MEFRSPLSRWRTLRPSGVLPCLNLHFHRTLYHLGSLAEHTKLLPSELPDGSLTRVPFTFGPLTAREIHRSPPALGGRGKNALPFWYLTFLVFQIVPVLASFSRFLAKNKQKNPQQQAKLFFLFTSSVLFGWCLLNWDYGVSVVDYLYCVVSFLFSLQIRSTGKGK